MMQIVYFSKKDQVLEYLKNSSQERVFITPSPLKADGLRLSIADWDQTDVVTIAKFTSDLLKLNCSEALDKVKRKSELLLIFGVLKNKFLPDLGYEQFSQAYNLFSDLRSYSLDEEALKSVLETQAEEIQKAVSIFWKLLEITEFMDEHGAYEKIAQSLRSAEHQDEINKTFIFWGFQHLNGQQVDLLKALSIRYQVIVPFPSELKEMLRATDWVSWLKDYKLSEVQLEEVAFYPKAKWLQINSREISSTLKNILRDDDQVVLGVSKISSKHIGVVPSGNVQFKIPHQLLTNEINTYLNKILVSEGMKQLSHLESFFLKEKSDLKNNKEVEKYFKKLRVIQLFEESLATIKELSDEDFEISKFFLRLLGDVILLNQPRTSFVPLAKDDLSITLTGMAGLDEINPHKRIFVCIDDRFDEIQSLGSQYTEEVQKLLKVLGPVKRNELDLLFKRLEFKELLSEGNVTVLMSPAILKHSLVWKKIFQEVELEVSFEKETREKKEIQDYFKDKIHKKFEGRFSASSLSAFVDCPRKFYLNNVERLFPRIVLDEDFDRATVGVLAHKVIERVINEKKDRSEIEKLTEEEILNHIQKHDLHLLPQKINAHKILIIHRATNGILFLQDIAEKANETIEWKIEESYELNDELRLFGKIDCVGISKERIYLLDFKSTKSSASTFTEILNFDSLQLWAYALGVSKQYSDFNKKDIVMGYVVLDARKSSNILCSSEEDKQLFSELCSAKAFEEPFMEIFNNGVQHMKELAQKIYAEEEFPIRPSHVGACNFCEVKLVCHKGELE